MLIVCHGYWWLSNLYLQPGLLSTVYFQLCTGLPHWQPKQNLSSSCLGFSLVSDPGGGITFHPVPKQYTLESPGLFPRLLPNQSPSFPFFSPNIFLISVSSLSPALTQAFFREWIVMVSTKHRHLVGTACLQVLDFSGYLAIRSQRAATIYMFFLIDFSFPCGFATSFYIFMLLSTSCVPKQNEQFTP